MKISEIRCDHLLPGLYRTHPSIVVWNGKRYMSYRVELHPPNVFSHTAVCECDVNWEPVSGSSVVLDVPAKRNLFGQKIIEDCRLFVFQGRLMFIVTNRHNLGLGELSNRLDVLRFDWLEVPPPQKNWMPFEWAGRLFVVYWVPKQIVREITLHTVVQIGDPSPGWEPWLWPYGEPHGGTPAIQTGGVFVGFFQSHTTGLPQIEDPNCVVGPNYVRRTYFAAPYAFEAEPPFRAKLVPKFPLLWPRLYAPGMRCPNGHDVVFPLGLVQEDDGFVVSWGDDVRGFISHFSKAEVFDCLQPL